MYYQITEIFAHDNSLIDRMADYFPISIYYHMRYSSVSNSTTFYKGSLHLELDFKYITIYWARIWCISKN